MPPGKKNGLWLHFDLEGMPARKAKCIYCSAILAYHPGSNSNLARHIKAKHKWVELRKGYAANLPQTQRSFCASDSQSVRKKTSPVWEHFTKLDDGKSMECKHCKKVLSLSSTNNFWRHLRQKHVDIMMTESDDGASAEEYGTNDFSEDEMVSRAPVNEKDNHQKPQKVSALQAFLSGEFPEVSTPAPRTYKLVSDKSPKIRVRPEFSSCYTSQKTALEPSLPPQQAPAPPAPQYIPIQYPAAMCGGSGNNMIVSEFDAIGKNVAFKLEKMSPAQFLLAETLINVILRRGVMKKLTEETSLCEGACRNVTVAPPAIPKTADHHNVEVVFQESGSREEGSASTTTNSDPDTNSIELPDVNVHNDTLSVPIIIEVQGEVDLGEEQQTEA